MIGENVKQLRTQAGLTQSDLAKQFNLSHNAVSSWETGTREPDLITVAKLADFFGVSIDALFGRSRETPCVIPIEKAPVLPEEEQELVEVYRALDAEGKAMVKAAAYGELRRMRALPDSGANVG